MKRVLALLIVACCLVMSAAVVASARDYDCDDFKYQQDAQSYYENPDEDLLSQDSLDADFDGVACELLPRESAFHKYGTGLLVLLGLVTVVAVPVLAYKAFDRGVLQPRWEQRRAEESRRRLAASGQEISKPASSTESSGRAETLAATEALESDDGWTDEWSSLDDHHQDEDTDWHASADADWGADADADGDEDEDDDPWNPTAATGARWSDDPPF